MKKAIKEKLMNLVQVNNDDSCIKTNLTTNKQIDLYKSVEEIDLKAFINNETDLVPVRNSSTDHHIEKDLKQAANIDEYLAILFDNGIELSNSRIQKLKDDFVNYRLEYIPNLVKQAQNKKLQFINLNRLAKQYSDDTTVWPLYLAYGFLKGKLPNSEILRAPILLYSVEIVENNNQLFIKKLDQDPIWNEKLEVVIKKSFNYLRENKQTIDFIKEESTSYNLNSIISALQENLSTTLNFIDGEVKPFIKESDGQLSEEVDMHLEPYCVLGIFEPSGGALKIDLAKIIEQDVDSFDDEYTKLWNAEQIADKVLKNQGNIFEINSPLNIYQKYAVLSALLQNTLIYGPPGTGKSEVIANIIFNALINGASSLLVSEKRAALDILTNRIGELALFSLNLYDLKNKASFYEKINALGEVLASGWFREKRKGVLKSNVAISPLKLNYDDLMFLRSFNEWYVELLELLKIHHKIEDYSDAIYKLDYAEFEKIKRQLGEGLVNEWLNRDENGQSLLERFEEQYYKYNFLVVQDLFTAWQFYVDFVKRTRLLDTLTPNALNGTLNNLLKKIRTNEKDVWYFLLNQNLIRKTVTNNQEFIQKYEHNKYFLEFSKLNVKEKNNFINKVEEFLTYYTKELKENFLLQNKSVKEIKELAEDVQKFYAKYVDIIKDLDLVNFAITNKYKISAFLNLYKTLQDSEEKKIVLGEFLINQSILTQKKEIEGSHLTIKELRSANAKAERIINFFQEFNAKQDVYSIPSLLDLTKYTDLVEGDMEFYKDLLNNKMAYAPNLIKMQDKFDWLFIPYLKDLYLNKGLIIFDYEEMQNLMRQIPFPITQEQYEMLRIVDVWSKIVKEEKRFAELTGFQINDIFIQLRRNETKAAKNIGEIVYTKIVEIMRENLTKLSDEDKHDLQTVFKISADRNSYPSITKFVNRYYKVLRYIFPIWVSRPESVATLIPLNQKEFDYGIFDEASQMFIERAYPCVYRCKIKIVSGDDKQLKPTSFFVNTVLSNDYDMDDFDRVNSLLERAKTSWWTEFNLRNHYRSDSKELIQFSNKFIYNNALQVATKQGCYEKAIEVFDVNGIFEDGINETEAKKIIELLKEHHHKYQKILIVSFNAKQANYISKLLLENYSKFDSELQQKIDRDAVIITNLENVQGNEGDLVILSVSYGKNAEGKMSTNFGPLITNGGSNRLNVAITRARKKMFIVKSLMGENITINNTKNNNAIIFKQFIDYADQEKTSISLLDQLNPQHINQLEVTCNEQGDINQDWFKGDDIIKEIYGELLKSLTSKYKLIPNLNISNKDIALTIFNKERNKVELLIIVEKWKENATVKAFLEDLDRQSFLEDRGYKTFRVRHYEWFINRNKIISHILKLLQPSNNEREPLNVTVFAKKVLYNK